MALTSVFTGRARSDLLSLEQYFQERNPAAGATVFEAIAASIRFLINYPLAAPLFTPDGVRLHPVPRTRYLLVYRVVGDQLELLRVLHQAQERTP